MEWTGFIGIVPASWRILVCSRLKTCLKNKNESFCRSLYAGRIKVAYRAVAYRRARRGLAPWSHIVTTSRRTIMGKYLIAWLLGVPAVVLVLIYLIF
ncbi:hypothetical protein [Massilia sp. METH4]|uniref:hypothetical protein n=1 Tax=Massilia sp. METH4 TaxID=3123041 RepID=UPI0030D25891